MSFIFAEFGLVKHLYSFVESTVAKVAVSLPFSCPVRFVTVLWSVTPGVVGRVLAFQGLHRYSYACCKLNFSDFVSVSGILDIVVHSCGKGHSKHQLSRDLASSVEESGFKVELKTAKLVRVIGYFEMGLELAPTVFSIVRV